MAKKPATVGAVVDELAKKHGVAKATVRAIYEAAIGAGLAWKCPACGRTILHNYYALVDVGNPICECDEDMELIRP